jgi:hypothetical protein
MLAGMDIVLYVPLVGRRAMRGWRACWWSARHPVLGRYTMAAFDPARRESVPLAMLALCLLAVSWAATAMVVVAATANRWRWIWLHDAMLALRNPLADRPMAALASLGDWVLVPAMLAGMGWLAWRRRWMAVLHWLAAARRVRAGTDPLLGATVTVVPARREQRLRLPVGRGDMEATIRSASSPC